MTAIPEELIEQVRDAADVIEIIGEEVSLRRTGSDYRGPCPFHGGKNRNFAVIPRKQMFYCFVCHEAGDIFTYFMKTRGIEYPNAVREVAQRVGVVIPERSTGGPDPKEPLYTAVSVAADWYAGTLREAPEASHARDYLASRKLDLERLGPLGLGFAPKGDRFLHAMEQLGIKGDVLLEAGLAVRREDQSVRPRFWGRLLFPIHDTRGRVVGFGGRVIGDGEPKYLNSPESVVFHKGRLLYNLHNAKPAIRRAERAVVVEGYVDVLRLVEAGVENVVAPLGTAFTQDQAALLKRYTKEVILFYDSDQAGMRATFRAADELLRVPLRVLIATPPIGEDPDTLALKGGAESVTKVLDDAIDVLERKLQLIERKGLLGSLAGRRRVLDRLMPTIRAAKDSVTQDLYVTRTATAVGVSQESIRREMSTGGRVDHMHSNRDAARRSSPESIGPTGPGRPERHLIRVMVHEPQWRHRIAEAVSDHSIIAQPERDLFERLRDWPDDLPVAEMTSHVEGPSRALLATFLQESWGAQDIDALVEGCVNRLESRRLEVQLNERQRRMPLAAEEEKSLLAAEIQTLGREIRRLNPARWPVSG